MKKNLKGNLKRWIAFLLAVVLIVTTCVYSSDAHLRAEGGAEPAETETVSETETIVAEDITGEAPEPEETEEMGDSGQSEPEVADDISEPDDDITLGEEVAPINPTGGNEEAENFPEAGAEETDSPVETESSDPSASPSASPSAAPVPSESPEVKDEYKVVFDCDSDKGTVIVKEPMDFTGFEDMVEKESTVKFTVEPKDGYQVDEVRVKGNAEPAEADGDGIYTLEINSDTNVKVAFAEDAKEREEDEEEELQDSYNVTISASKNGTVTVNTSDEEAVKVVSSFSKAVEEGTGISFTVEPNEGYTGSVVIDGKTADAVSISENSSAYELNIKSDMEVEVTFTAEEEKEVEDEEVKEYKVTINVPEAKGTVTVNTSDESVDATNGFSGTVEKGSSLIFDVEPDEGYIVGVTVNGETVDAASTDEDVSRYELYEISADTEVSVGFISDEEEAKEYGVTLNVPEAIGTVTVNTPEGEAVGVTDSYSTTVKEKREFSFAVKPERKYNSLVKVNGILTGAASKTSNVSTYAVTVEGETEIEVTFIEKVNYPVFEGIAEAGGVTVTVKAVEGVLPEGTKVVAKDVSSSEIESVISDAVEEDKEVVNTTAIDVTLQDQDGNEVQPVEGRDVIVTFSGISASDEATSMAVYHVDDAVSLADKVTGDRTVSDSIVFMAGHFSIYTVVQEENITTGSENYQMFVGDTLVIESGLKKWANDQSPTWESNDPKVVSVESSYTDNQSKGTIQAKKTGIATVTVKGENTTKTYTIEVVIKQDGTYPLYVYGLKPGGERDAGANNNWYGLGTGFISGAQSAPTKGDAGKELNKKGDFTGISLPKSFPDIVYPSPDGETYKYAESGSEYADKRGYYTIVWEDVKVADGANSGINQYNPMVANGTYTFHLDGLIYVNQADKVTIGFLVKNPGETNFTPIIDAAKTVDGGYEEKNLTPPTMQEKDGYRFDGWYTDEICTQKVEFSTSQNIINTHTNYYGKYVANSYGYRIEYYYDNVKDDEATEWGTAKFGSKVSQYESKDKVGYKLQSDPGSITITQQVEDNVLKVYYVKRTDLSYTVNYLEKETEKVLKSAEVTSGKEFGAEINGKDVAIEIDGYKFVDSKPEMLIITVADGDNENAENVINLYYCTTISSYNVVYNFEEGTPDKLEVPGFADIGDPISKFYYAPDTYDYNGKHYMLDRIEGKEKVVDRNAENNEVNIYYVLDEIGGGENPDEPDNIPDKYQRRVTFQVANGTWTDETPKSMVVTFDKAGDGYGTSYTLAPGEIPGTKANTGYKGGNWGVEGEGTISASGLPETISGDVTYTFTYGLGSYKYSVEYYYDDVNGNWTLGEAPEEGMPTEGEKEYGETVSVEPKDKVEVNGVKYLFDKVVNNGLEIKDNESDSDASNVIEVYYTRDMIGNPANPDSGDGVPDKYQVVVSYNAAMDGEVPTGTVSLAKAVVTLLDADGNRAVRGTEGAKGYLVATQIPMTIPNTAAGYREDSKSWAGGIEPTKELEITGDTTFTVSWNNLYTLTIRYQYADGTEIRTVSTQYAYGADNIQIPVPELEGYTCDWQIGEFKFDTTLGEDKEYVVTYTAIPGVPDPTDGPDVLDPGTDPDTDPDDPVVPPVPEMPEAPGTPDTPAPPIDEGPVPVTPPAAGTVPPALATPALVAVADAQVPLDGIITEDEDGNIVVMPVEDEEVPLADRELADHECCILSFLLMLATLIIYSCFTHNMKKRQKKLAELKDQLAEETLRRQLGIADQRGRRR